MPLSVNNNKTLPRGPPSTDGVLYCLDGRGGRWYKLVVAVLLLLAVAVIVKVMVTVATGSLS